VSRAQLPVLYIMDITLPKQLMVLIKQLYVSYSVLCIDILKYRGVVSIQLVTNAYILYRLQ